jgi:NADH-quinone oxidoreductase subunit M
MLNHGINVVGMFFVLDIIIRSLGTREMSAMGGIAKAAPQLAITFLIVLLGSVALPLTNGFIGEFLLLMGLYQYNLWAAVIAGLTIVFGAVYMLRAYQHIMLGESTKATAAFTDLDFTEKMALYTICGLIILIGVFPQPILNLTEPAVNSLLQVVNAKILAIH